MSLVNTVKLELDVDIYESEDDFRDRNSKFKYIKKGKGMCFNYALQSQAVSYCEDGYIFIEENYDKVSFEDVKKGDLMTFHDLDFPSDTIDDWNCKHFGKLKEKGGTVEDTVIKSKLGNWSVYECKIKDLPDIYGDTIIFWRRKK